MMQRIRWFLLILGIVVLLVFSLANRDPVSVEMPFVFNADLPLSMLLLVTSAIGFILGSVMTAWMLHRNRKATEKAEAEAAAAVAAVESERAESDSSSEEKPTSEIGAATE